MTAVVWNADRGDRGFFKAEWGKGKSSGSIKHFKSMWAVFCMERFDVENTISKGLILV